MMTRSTMPDLGEAVLRTYANAPGDESASLLTSLTGHRISPSRVKRFFTEEAMRMHTQEQAFFDAELATPNVAAEGVLQRRNAPQSELLHEPVLQRLVRAHHVTRCRGFIGVPLIVDMKRLL